MITRQIGKIVRGKATPLQIIMAAILGAMLGFMPGFWEAPGLIIALTLLLIVLNANLAVAAMVGLLAKLVSFGLLPISFEVGRVMLDGPTQGIFKAMINAPGTALMGLEHYLTTGSALVGFVFGLICGLVIVKMVSGFRRKMSSLEEGSALYQKWASTKSVKLLAFVFIGGGKGKKTYADLLAKRSGNPIRVLGVVFAVLVVALLWVMQAYLSGPILTMTMRDGLERANGATVDLGNAQVDLKEGKMVIAELAMADPKALDTDLLRAKTIEADINSTDLLRKRAKFDQVVIRDATSGLKRAVPGVLTGPPIEPSPPADPLPDEQSMDQYIKQAKVWKDRLAQAREWLEKIGGEPQEDDPAQKQETLEDRIKRQIRESGYASVKATHLVEGAPTLVISRLVADGVTTSQIEGEVFDIHAENLSTHPRLVKEAPTITIESRSKRITALAGLGGAAKAGETNQLRFTCLSVPVDSVCKSLNFDGQAPVQGGLMDIDIRGQWSAMGVGNLDMPLNITLHDTTVSIANVGAQKVTEMKLPIGLRGPMDNLNVYVDSKKVAAALKDAGADALASHVRGEADERIAQAKDKATEKVTEKVDKAVGDKIDQAIGDNAKGVLGELFPGKGSN